MRDLLRVAAVGGAIACTILLLALGVAQRPAALLAPVDLLLLALSTALYLFPTGLAMYRDCRAACRIAAVNLLLGWTVLGWVIALMWAAQGSVRLAIPLPPRHRAIPRHI